MHKIASLEDLVGLEHGKIGYYQELQLNLRRLKEAHERLQARSEEVQAILDGLTDIIMVLAPDFSLLHTNHAFQQRFPGQPDTVHCHQLFANRDTPCAKCPARDCLEANIPVRSTHIHELQGRFRHFDIVATPLVLNGLETILVLYRDITTDVERQAQFQQAERMATVGMLAAGVAHEINNPLAAIQGFTEGLKRKAKKSGVQDESFLADFTEYTDIILGECARCRDIVRSLLSFSHPRDVRRSAVNINTCIRETMFLLKHYFKEQSSLQLELQLDENLPYINGDEAQLKQVIINLCINAVDAMGERGGRLSLRSNRVIRKGVWGVEFCCEDTGCGISPENKEKLFEPFFSTKTVGKGVGIGLSTCYTIVRNHQGEITVQSEPGKGAVFTIFLPEEQL